MKKSCTQGRQVERKKGGQNEGRHERATKIRKEEREGGGSRPRVYRKAETLKSRKE